MRTDLIVPALNEEEALPALFAALEPLRDRSIDRIVVCDNGSTDRTPQIAQDLGAQVVHEPQRGYGAACLKGLSWLAGESRAPRVVTFLDADLADDPAALPRLIEPIASNEADVVIGSRVALAEAGALNAVQRFGNALACGLIRSATGTRFSDLGPFRAVRWETLRGLEMNDRTWGWTVELQMKAALRGVRCREVDVPYRRRRFGRSKISGTVTGVARAGSKIVWTIGALWLAERRRHAAPRPDGHGASTGR